MKILVLWAEPNENANLGVRVLAEGAAAVLYRAFGEEVVVEYQDFGPAGSGLTLGRRAIVEDALSIRKAISRRLKQYDLIYDTGAGDSFTDAYGLRRLMQMAYVQNVARKAGIPLVLGPQTIGPFNSRMSRPMARRTLNSASLVMARDSESVSISRRYGREPDALSTDVVFALGASAADSQPREVILNVSGLLWGENPHVDYLKYRDGIRLLIATLLREGRRVTLLAHVVGKDVQFVESEAQDNDVPVTRMLYNELAHPNLECVIPRDLSEARAVLGSATVVVGSRMHACLNALSLGTVAIPLAYSQKFDPLLRDLGWSTTIDLRKSEPFPPAVLSLLRDVDALRALKESTNDVRLRAERRLDTCTQLLRGITR